MRLICKISKYHELVMYMNDDTLFTYHTAMTTTLTSNRTTSPPPAAPTCTARPSSCLTIGVVIVVGMGDFVGSGVAVSDNELLTNEYG